MLTVNKLIPQGRGLAGVLLKRAATVELDWATRQQHRLQATDSSGRALDVQLPPGTVLRGGDVLVAEDGSMVRVLPSPADPADPPVEGQGVARGKSIGIPIKAAAVPHVHGPGCGHDH